MPKRWLASLTVVLCLLAAWAPALGQGCAMTDCAMEAGDAPRPEPVDAPPTAEAPCHEALEAETEPSATGPSPARAQAHSLSPVDCCIGGSTPVEGTEPQAAPAPASSSSVATPLVCTYELPSGDEPRAVASQGTSPLPPRALYTRHRALLL